MKIIHISDLHFGSTKINSQSIHRSTAQLVNLILNHYDNTVEKPLILITGDILASSFAKRKSKKVYFQLKKLKDAGHQILTCVGNHDLKRSGLFPSVNARRKFDTIFRRLLPKGSNIKGDIANNFFTSPMTHVFGTYYFIGLDSMIAASAIGAKGEIGFPQRERLKQLITDIRAKEPDAKIITYLHHSPFTKIDNLKLMDRDKLMEIISGTNGLFFGHHHKNIRYTDEEATYAINCIINSGASTLGQYRWTEINLSDYSSTEYPIS